MTIGEREKAATFRRGLFMCVHPRESAEENLLLAPSSAATTAASTAAEPAAPTVTARTTTASTTTAGTSTASSAVSVWSWGLRRWLRCRIYTVEVWLIAFVEIGSAFESQAAGYGCSD